MIKIAGIWFRSREDAECIFRKLQLQDHRDEPCYRGDVAFTAPQEAGMETTDETAKAPQDDFGGLSRRHAGVEAGQTNRSRRVPEGARFNGEAIAQRQVEGLDFGQALRVLRQGERVARAGWNGRGQYLELQSPNHLSRMTLPYIFIHTVQGDLVPWVASQTDLLAGDWVIVTERTVLQYGAGGPTLKA